MHLAAPRITFISLLLSGTVKAACPDGCSTCDTYDICTTCKPHKWGLTARCAYYCSTKCVDTECQDDNGYCTACTEAYGPQCQHNCSLCQDGQCDLRKCTLGCKSGYYEYKTSTETFCQSCPSDCKSCNGSNVCNICNDGFHLYEFMSEGNIYVYCVQCPREKNCKSCKIQSESVVCTACYDGFELDDESCTQQGSNVSICSSSCSSTCDENGTCLGSCNTGWTGESCNDRCASNCLMCDKVNAYLCKECNGDFYATTCNVPCSSSCAKVSGQTTCGIHDGYCLNGCEKKVWGPSCNISCSYGCAIDGLSQVCERDNGSCTRGCIDGYDGDMCDNKMTTKQKEVTTTESKLSPTNPTASKTDDKELGNGGTSANVKKDDSNAIIIGASAGGGVVLLILIVAVVFCCLKRR